MHILEGRAATAIESSHGKYSDVAIESIAATTPATIVGILILSVGSRNKLDHESIRKSSMTKGNRVGHVLPARSVVVTDWLTA